MNPTRVRQLKPGIKKTGPVIYWMQRDQRFEDNWALIYSVENAKASGSPIIVIFNMVTTFLGATFRQYDFMINGLKEIEKKLLDHNIPFVLLTGNPIKNIPEFIDQSGASQLITDFNPLRLIRIWKRDIAKKIKIPFYEVDAHNLIPCCHISQKIEYAAYTLRPKIKRNMSSFLDSFPKIAPFKSSNLAINSTVSWDDCINSLKINRDVKPVDWIKPGEVEARKTLNKFLSTKISNYASGRNDPNLQYLSNLSPYLHFGQISAQRIALETLKIAEKYPESVESFIEELIVRRELSDNFCYYNHKYDSFDGFHDWAKLTLNQHRRDEREYTYNLDEFERALTHDPLWNAAQNEMVIKGKMHGYMRMYWAKKILEWTETPEQALEFGIYLNDKYELDGRDPNGYVGVAWSVGGVHDRAWFERPVFGKIRYMNYNGCKRKFKVDEYIDSIRLLQESFIS